MVGVRRETKHESSYEIFLFWVLHLQNTTYRQSQLGSSDGDGSNLFEASVNDSSFDETTASVTLSEEEVTFSQVKRDSISTTLSTLIALLS